MKQFIENVLIYLLGKLNMNRLKGIRVDDLMIQLVYEKAVPDDGEWHHIAQTSIVSVKNDKKGNKKYKINSAAIYVDGDKKASCTLEELVK
jgi:hypothetical protein